MHSLKVKPRLYQEDLFSKAVNKNTLIVLPTGLGKTLIALMLSIHRINTNPNKKVMILAPTKPLASQHQKSFINDSSIKEEECTLLTGAMNPSERSNEYNKRFIFATPQTIENDIITGKVKLNDYSLIIFDEAHRAQGNYAYCFIAKYCAKEDLRILGITASPGTNKDSITMLTQNLYITQVLHRTERDADVKPYINKKEIKKIYLELPAELKEILKSLNKSLSSSLKDLKDMGAVKTQDPNKVSKREVLKLQGEAVRKLKEDNDYNMYGVMSSTARTIKVMHALELVQTQGVAPLINYFDGLKKQKSKATNNLMSDIDWRNAMTIAYNTQVEHPKFGELIKILKSNPNKNSLIFTQYRATAKRIIELLNNESLSASLFVGQRGRDGMTQKKQLEILDKFRQGEFKTLVATSISEEGLDIPSIDSAIFFEPVPSALRSVQRRGRVGRAKAGEVYVLMTKGTIDERYHWSSYYKEKRMKEALDDLSNTNLLQKTLSTYF